MSCGILSFGACVPPPRIERSAIAAAVGWAVSGVRGLAAGERAVANRDADAVTMAAKAGRDCLAGLDVAVPHLTLASTTLPFADRSNSGITQLRGRARERQLPSPSMGLTHNLGGHPFRNVAGVSVLGLHAA